MFRKATAEDIPIVSGIYSDILDEEESGRTSTGWERGTYPTEGTAAAAHAAGELFVMEVSGHVVAAGRINRQQMPAYSEVDWQHEASPEEVMVLHTLVVSPAEAGKGYGTAFVKFYEEYARANNCTCLRIDTNARNLTARRLYKKLGYSEAGIVPCVFCGIEGVALVCIEKKLADDK